MIAETTAVAPHGPLLFGTAFRACPGELVCGDAMVVAPGATRSLVAIIDGLGHGSEAHAAAQKAQRFLEAAEERDVAVLIESLHDHLRGTCGASAGLCIVHNESGAIDYAGVGNTVIRRFGSKETRLVSRDGNLGHNARRTSRQDMQLESGDVVLLYTDGVKDRFALDDYRGLLFHEPAAVAETVLERFGKDHDDAACVVLRYRR